jgi:hypothetical protein
VAAERALSDIKMSFHIFSTKFVAGKYFQRYVPYWDVVLGSLILGAKNL